MSNYFHYPLHAHHAPSKFWIHTHRVYLLHSWSTAACKCILYGYSSALLPNVLVCLPLDEREGVLIRVWACNVHIILSTLYILHAPHTCTGSWQIHSSINYTITYFYMLYSGPPTTQWHSGAVTTWDRNSYCNSHQPPPLLNAYFY